jgi:hypothetical protein
MRGADAVTWLLVTSGCILREIARTDAHAQHTTHASCNAAGCRGATAGHLYTANSCAPLTIVVGALGRRPPGLQG